MSMDKSIYLKLYDSLPRDAKEAMFMLWETGKNDSGVWVRYGDVEATVGRIVDAMLYSQEQVQILPGRLGTLAICAIRYCQGRETYMPRMVRDIVRPFLPYLADLDLLTMLMDCERQKKYSLYGENRSDKPEWDEWREQLEAELKRREEDRRREEVPQ